MASQPADPATVVRQAVSSLRTVGTVFVLLGIALLALAFPDISQRRPLLGVETMASTSFLMIGRHSPSGAAADLRIPARV